MASEVQQTGDNTGHTATDSVSVSQPPSGT